MTPPAETNCRDTSQTGQGQPNRNYYADDQMMPATRRRHDSRHFRNTVSEPQQWLEPAADRAGAVTQPQRQAAGRLAGHSAQRQAGQPGSPRQGGPSHDTQGGGTGVAHGGKHRGQKQHCCTAATGGDQLARIMHRSCDRNATAGARAASTAQMHPGAQARRERRVARHHQCQTPVPAETREVPPQTRAARHAVMAQHHPAQPARQGRHGSARVGQAARIGEQPKWRHANPAPRISRLDRPPPADKPAIHDPSCP